MTRSKDEVELLFYLIYYHIFFSFPSINLQVVPRAMHEVELWKLWFGFHFELRAAELMLSDSSVHPELF